MDSGAAQLVMPEGMFPRVTLERKTLPKRFVAATGEKDSLLKTNEGVQRCITFRSASVVKPLFNAESCPSGKHCGAG